MEKFDLKKHGELEQLIYAHLQKAFRENQYTLELEGKVFANDGYLDASVMICGTKFRCAVNEKNYICWFCGEPMSELLNNVPHLVRKIVAQTKRIIRVEEEKNRNKRIEELRKELEELTKQC